MAWYYQTGHVDLVHWGIIASPGCNELINTVDVNSLAPGDDTQHRRAWSTFVQNGTKPNVDLPASVRLSPEGNSTKGINISIVKCVWKLLPHSSGWTHWGPDKIASILQTTFSNAFSLMKIYKSLLVFHWSLFLRVQLRLFQPWFRKWLGASQAIIWTNADPIHWRIYAALGGDELTEQCNCCHTAYVNTSFIDNQYAVHHSGSGGIIEWSPPLVIAPGLQLYRLYVMFLTCMIIFTWFSLQKLSPESIGVQMLPNWFDSARLYIVHITWRLHTHVWICYGWYFNHAMNKQDGMGDVITDEGVLVVC